MSDQFSLFNQTTSRDSEDVTFSQGSQSGTTPSSSPGGTKTGRSGRAPVLVNPSAMPAKAKRSTIRGTFGQLGFHSSKHGDLSLSLASRYRALTDSLGSTLFKLTWIKRATPSGRWIPAQRASEVLTKDHVCIGRLA